jgi:phosphinothricin acetyltransferase
MNFTIRKAVESDTAHMADIFNYYIRNSFAAFPVEEVEAPPFFGIMKNISFPGSVYAVDVDGKMVGFGIIKRFFESSVFNRSAEPGYFILPGLTGKGIGAKLLETMETDGRKLEIKAFFVSVASLNTGSLDFHKKHGFIECGRFDKVGYKKGREFDIVWMKKNI